MIDMMHLQELFAGRTRKRSLDRLKAENLKDIELKLTEWSDLQSMKS